VVAHAIEQAVNVRAGPVSVLLTAPVVATLVYLRYRDATRRALLALLAWGVLGTGAAVVVVAIWSIGYYLPRPLTDLEMLGYDFGLFLWFVLTLGAAYAIAARTGGRRAVVALLAGPVAQGAFALLVTLLVEAGLYG
jgi:riboflavin transporter FmnP